MSALVDYGTIGVADPKTHLSAVLEKVIAGRQMTITRHSHPIAQLSPVASPTCEQRRQAIQAIREIAKAAKPLPAGVTIEGFYKEDRV
jgi:antitoxin (DNA-binding transcriptional repressor) of toxin-antitoxin stability system